MFVEMRAKLDLNPAIWEAIAATGWRIVEDWVNVESRPARKGLAWLADDSIAC